ncbi:ROK family protein [Kineosporia rhizophila]|uniref:ROK family protein n=1 Tax=Kineosporia TaxID=49184 RepID=UPI001E4D0500|nr:ROK family protein [Kineosporia sp. NBRC 101677]MCE0540813.1 ROK family protein [Kineosporia rhizophila]GLY18141.1 glucokinase [Kineosporia sp. NBRC 101677]
MTQPPAIRTPASWVVVGLDNGGTTDNATVLDATGQFLVDQLVEIPSRVLDGPELAVEALADSFENICRITNTPLTLVKAVGLDTPGPASAAGVISSKGATNFSAVSWHGFDIRAALERRLGLPVVYNNDANAASLYAHHRHFGPDEAMQKSSVAGIVGTGFGGGVVHDGRVIKGVAGMAGELGHVQIPVQDVIESDQPIPRCNCGFLGDVESLASLTGIKNNLLPYWLPKFPDHPLAGESISSAAKQLRGYAEREDPLALAVFGQQAKAIGKLFTIAANFTDPDVYFVGGGVVEAAPSFRQWFLNTVREHTQLRQEQIAAANFALVPDLDMAGARGAAVAAFDAVVADR